MQKLSRPAGGPSLLLAKPCISHPLATKHPCRLRDSPAKPLAEQQNFRTRATLIEARASGGGTSNRAVLSRIVANGFDGAAT